ncbi:pyrroline-5-carboxylate reductase [Sarocladium strictum]
MTSRQSIAFIGCGNMGRAVLLGLLDCLHPVVNGDSEEATTSPRLSRFIATTRTEASARKLRQSLGRHVHRVDIHVEDSHSAVEAADILILGFKAYAARQILSQTTLCQAMSGKLVISLLAGFSIEQLFTLITTAGNYTQQDLVPPIVAKAVPNMATRVSQSTTILELPRVEFPDDEAELVKWIFSQVGTTVFVPQSQVDIASMLATNVLAAMSVALEGLLDGAVVGGLRRAEAVEIATQGIAGFGAMLEAGEHPSLMRETIVSPGGSTAQSLLTLEKAATRAVFAQAQASNVYPLMSC